MINQPSKTAITIPNILTLLRILLTPLFVILLLRDQFGFALLVFSIAGISDGLDGFLARHLNQRTELGAFLDPVADKILLISAFVCLAVLGVIPDWLAVIVISRDILIVLGIAILTIREKEYEIKPTMVSKATTTVQIIMVIVSLLGENLYGFAGIRTPLMWITAVLTTISGLHYMMMGMNILQDPPEENFED